jgi:hypothetical protein
MNIVLRWRRKKAPPIPDMVGNVEFMKGAIPDMVGNVEFLKGAIPDMGREQQTG